MEHVIIDISAYSRQQLGVIVRNILNQLLPAITQEIRQRGVAVRRECYLIRLGPHLHADQGDEYVQRHIQLQTHRHIPSRILHRDFAVSRYAERSSQVESVLINLSVSLCQRERRIYRTTPRRRPRSLVCGDIKGPN